MPEYIRLVCLANSRKLQERCVAGVALEGDLRGAWIRPVTRLPHQEVRLIDRQYEDGGDPILLDILSVPVLSALPGPHQPENVLLDPDYYWIKEGELHIDELAQFVTDEPELWRGGGHTYEGCNDRIAEAERVDRSLQLVYVEDLAVRVYTTGAIFGNPRRRVQARFTFKGRQYWLSITDPAVEQQYYARADGTYAVGAAYLCVSLGEPYDGFCYKLVAGLLVA